MVRQAVAVARERGVEWAHLDNEPHLGEVYRAGQSNAAGAALIHLR